jgi:hypothetical protein
MIAGEESLLDFSVDEEIVFSDELPIGMAFSLLGLLSENTGLEELVVVSLQAMK